MKYDIAKNGEGPLTKTVKNNPAAPLAHSSSSCANDSVAPEQSSSQVVSSLTPDRAAVYSTKKRKYEAVEDPKYGPDHAPPKRKGKGRTYDDGDSEAAEVDGEQLALAAATAEKHPGLHERLENIEAHLALRYGEKPKASTLPSADDQNLTVPTPPRTLLARLKYLEDHIVRLEKEYPPWAALHFNQPNRGVSICQYYHSSFNLTSICLFLCGSGLHLHAQPRLLFHPSSGQHLQHQRKFSAFQHQPSPVSHPWAPPQCYLLKIHLWRPGWMRACLWHHLFASPSRGEQLRACNKPS